MFEKIDVSRMSRDFQKEPWRKRIDKPIRSDFEYLYLELNLCAEEITAYLGISGPTLSRAIREFNLYKTPEQKKAIRAECNIKKFGSASPWGDPEILARVKNTMVERYGTDKVQSVESIKAKTKKTNNERYGGNSPMCSKEVQRKSRETCRERCGEDFYSQSDYYKELFADKYEAKTGYRNPFQNPEVKAKSRATVKERYGVDYVSQSPEVIQKVKETNLKKYGVDNVSKSPEIIEKIKQVHKERYGCMWTQKDFLNKDNFNKEFWEENFINRKGKFCVSDCAMHHGINRVTVLEYYKKFNISAPLKYESIGEHEILQYCKTLGYKGKKDRRVLDGSELDILIEEANLAIEYNGVLYHGSGDTLWNNRTICDNYHLTKATKCWEKGLTLLQIWDYEWTTPTLRNVWRGIIRDSLNMLPTLNNVQIVSVDNTSGEFTDFENKHSLRASYNTTLKVLVKSNGNVIACASVEIGDVCEIVSLWTNSNTSLKHSYVEVSKWLRKNYNRDVYVRLDNRLFNPNHFELLGFSKVSEEQPQAYIVEKFTITSKKSFETLVPVELNSDEDINTLQAEGFIVLHDCGQTIMKLK